MSVEDRVKLIIADQIGVEEGEVTPYADLTNDLGADSLDQVELVMAFEEEFGLNIPDTDAEEIRRVMDAIAYIEECLEKK